MTEKTQGAQATRDAQAAQGPQDIALRVVRGEPSPEELVALVAVLAARSAAGTEGQAAEAPKPTSGWTDRARYVRSGRQEFGARSGWRASALPS